MNATEIDYRAIFNEGKRQRKYVGNISPVARQLADLLIAHAIKVEDSQGVYWFYVDDSNCTAFEIRQSDSILSLALTQVGATSNFWERQWYKLGKTITKEIVEAVQTKMIAQEIAAAPVADATQVEAPASDSDKAYIERLEEERAESQVTIAALHAQLKEAQADLSAAQGIIIQAGKDFQALRNENAELRKALQADTPTPQSPVSEVTLTDDEIEWLRQWNYTEIEGIYAFSVPSGKMNVHIVDKMTLEIRLFDLPMHNWWRLDNRHDTPANRAAIEKRRNELGE